MTKARSMRATLLIAAACALIACVTLPSNKPRSPQDPWESWNRGVYKFNTVMDKAFVRPVARAYVKVVPNPCGHRSAAGSGAARVSRCADQIVDIAQGSL